MLSCSVACTLAVQQPQQPAKPLPAAASHRAGAAVRAWPNAATVMTEMRQTTGSVAGACAAAALAGLLLLLLKHAYVHRCCHVATAAAAVSLMPQLPQLRLQGRSALLQMMSTCLQLLRQ